MPETPDAIPMHVSIDHEAVTRQVTEAILKSALGAKIEKAVNDALQERYGGRSVVDNAIASEIESQTRIIARETLREGPSRDLIAEKLTAALSDEAISKIVEKFVHQLGLITADDIDASR